MMFMRRAQETVEDAAAVQVPPRLTEAQAAAMIRAKEAELAAKALEDRAAFEREKLEAERAAWRADQERTTRAAKVVQARSTWSKRLSQAVAMFPITTTTTMAMIGQFGWGLDHLDQIGSSPTDVVRIVVVTMFAAGLESLGLFLGYHADRALQRRDSAFGMYLGAFTVSGIVGALNYSHYASTTQTTTILGFDLPGATATAVVFALFSFVNPALWRIHSRAKNRDRLKANGEIDTRAVRLSWSRKLWHPVRSIRTMYWATWDSSVQTPADAVALYEAKTAAKRAAKEAERAKKAAQSAEVPAQERPRRATAPAATTVPEETPDLLGIPAGAPVPIVAQRHAAAWNAFVASVQAGNPLTQRALAREHLNGNRHHARDIMAAWEEVRGHDHDARETAA